MTRKEWFPRLWDDIGDEHPLPALRDRMNALFEEFAGGGLTKGGDFVVRSNVSETDEEVRVTAELPGIEMENIDVSVSGNLITIQGEKASEEKEESEEEGRQFHRIERRSGSFRRSMTLPFEIDADRVSADCRDGVLTVTIPKPAAVPEKTRKIEVKASAG